MNQTIKTIYDDFDGDLYRLIPEAEELIAPLSKIYLSTHGKAYPDGRLQSPAVWNHPRGFIAFFGIAGTGKPEQFWTNDPIIRCSAEDAIRICFVSSYMIHCFGFVVFDGFSTRNEFNDLLFDQRGIFPIAQARRLAIKTHILKQLAYSVFLFRENIKPYQISNNFSNQA